MIFSNKIALVTGGTRGIGASVARAFATLGCEVHVTYAQSKESAQQLERDSKALAGTIVAHRVDSFYPEQIEAFGRDFANTVNELDFLILNAGTASIGTIGDISLEEYQRVTTINETSVFALTNVLVNHINSNGRIVIVSSTLGESASLPGFSVYNASKASVSMMARSWARDLADRGILVNAIQPGPIDTDLNPDSSDNPGAAAQKSRIPLGRYGKPEEVSSVIQFLCSEGSSFITGACINVDGGWSA